jgi:hypothetical protein
MRKLAVVEYPTFIRQRKTRSFAKSSILAYYQSIQ